MGAKCDKGDDADKVAKSATLEQENEMLRKQMADALPAIVALQADIEKLKALPAPMKHHIISKGEDNGGEGNDLTKAMTAEELLVKFTPEELALAAFKISHASGGSSILKRG
jgi:hypothetical protein